MHKYLKLFKMDILNQRLAVETERFSGSQLNLHSINSGFIPLEERQTQTKNIPFNNIKEISLLIEDKQAGEFKAEIEFLQVY